MFKLWEVEFGPPAARFLKKADNILKRRLFIKIDRLKEDPFPTDCKRVVGRQEKVFRVRVGDYRILYAVFYEENKILIADIDKRPRIY